VGREGQKKLLPNVLISLIRGPCDACIRLVLRYMGGLDKLKKRYEADARRT
jgi:hypothetical protein